MPTLRAKKSSKRVRRQPAKSAKSHAALRLLVALDEAGAHANAVIDTAMALTKAHRAKAEAMSVVDPMAAAWLTVGVPVATVGEAMVRGEQRLRRLEIRRYLADRTGARPPWRIRVPLGAPADAILDAAHGADLVIMGLRRERLIERIVHDATTPHVVRECTVPVLAVTPELRGMPRTIVIAADFSAESNAAARLACRLFTGCAKFVFVHIESDFDAAIANLDEVTRMVRENDWAAAFQGLIETLSVPAGAKVETVVVRGTVPRTLLAFAGRRGADLLVVGRQRHDDDESLLVGSVTAGLVRRAPCSLLITPPTV